MKAPESQPKPGPQTSSGPQPQPGSRSSYLSFKEMPIWQSAMAAAEQVFALTDRLPRKEDYGFTSQIQRAALSISANISEAFGRNHTLDKINFYFVARGSLTETQSHLEYGRRVGYVDPASAQKLDSSLAVIHSDLNRVIATLRKSLK
jgi:four helix bundle protein